MRTSLATRGRLIGGWKIEDALYLLHESVMIMSRTMLHVINHAMTRRHKPYNVS